MCSLSLSLSLSLSRSLSLSLYWGGRGKTGAALLSSDSAAAQAEAWLQRLLQTLAIAGPAGLINDALLCHRFGSERGLIQKFFM